MELILPFNITPPERQFNIKDSIVLMGSCFAEEMGLKLKERRFNALLNPHGILFNPLSMAEALEDYQTKKQYTQKDIFPANELWHSFKHHGAFSNSDNIKCLQHINMAIDIANVKLKNCKWLILTFGSAHAYRLKEDNTLVANCHKVPSSNFTKILLTKEEIVSTWQKQIDNLKKSNPALNILFTVSPVRYIRDGIIENNRSKAILLDSVHKLAEQNVNCSYFPAYEIVIDELRDYRFFKEDLVHPNELAIKYVWEKFVNACCDNETQNFLKEYEPLLQGMHHRPLQENTEAYKKFKSDLEDKLKAIGKKYHLS
ncbi:MAG: GSCFA domain-containing protein [Bacteroidia bacterium]